MIESTNLVWNLSYISTLHFIQYTPLRNPAWKAPESERKKEESIMEPGFKLVFVSLSLSLSLSLKDRSPQSGKGLITYESLRSREHKQINAGHVLASWVGRGWIYIARARDSGDSVFFFPPNTLYFTPQVHTLHCTACTKQNLHLSKSKSRLNNVLCFSASWWNSSTRSLSLSLSPIIRLCCCQHS